MKKATTSNVTNEITITEEATNLCYDINAMSEIPISYTYKKGTPFVVTCEDTKNVIVCVKTGAELLTALKGIKNYLKALQ